MERIITTNCWAYDGQRILLGLKKRGFAEGKWNGFGGKLLPGETLEQAARREVAEECGITITEMDLLGTVVMEYRGKDKIMEVNIFHVKSFDGEPKESEEMRPQWFKVEELPMASMWPDDEHWLPLFLKGLKFKGHFIFEGYDKIINHSLEII